MKHLLITQLKKKSSAWLWFLFLGAHYAYMGRIGMQLLFWFTFGGCGIWTLVTFFTLNGMVEKHNDPIIAEISKLEDRDAMLMAKLANS